MQTAAAAAAERLRKINLIEVLKEKAGADVREEQEELMLSWSEEEICSYFATTTVGTNINGIPSPPIATKGSTPRPPSLSLAHKWADPDPQELQKWFPALSRLSAGIAGGGGDGTAVCDGAVVVLCFPNSGSCEDIYTSEGTGSRRTPSPLLDWCRAIKALLLGVQPPGRAARTSEPPCPDLGTLAQQLLPVVAPMLARARRYFVIGHSVGAWAAFEFLRLAQSKGLPMPAAAFLSAMPPPDCAEEVRPWRQQAALGEEEFKEECRAWGINDVAFVPQVWQTFHPLLRADFKLFDEYKGPSIFTFPLFAFWGEADTRVGRDLVAGWARFTRDGFQLVAVPAAEHLWPCNGNAAAKRAWLERVVAEMAALA